MNQRPRSRLAIFLTVLTFVANLLVPSTLVAAPPPGIPDGWSDGYVYANGIRIHYYRAVPAPGKPVMVMLHGLSDIGLCWTTLTWKLQDAYDIYMVDARGHGLTDPVMPGDNSDTAVKDAVEFVRVMKFEKPILMGHSMGGATVIRLGAEYQDLAKAIMVLDAGIPNPRPPAPAAATTAPVTHPRPAAPAESPRPADPLSVTMFGSPETLVKQNNYSFEDLVAKARRQFPKWDLVDCQYWALSKKQYHGVYSEELRQAISGGMRTAESLPKLMVPTLILKADEPAETRQAHQESAKVIPKGKLVHIDGAGHNLHHDQLARTVEVIQEFLGGL